MPAPEYFKSFPRRTHTTFLYILNALPDSLSGICVGGDVKQTLIGFGILHDRFRLSIDCKNQRFLFSVRRIGFWGFLARDSRTNKCQHLCQMGA